MLQIGDSAMVACNRFLAMNDSERESLLKRGVAEIIVESEFVDLLESGKSLRLKMGFDPSAPDIHMGHAVGLRKLRQLQELGHKVVLIVGDWTAQIGDPSGRSQTRPMLTAEEVRQNAETYLTQFFKVVDRDRAEIRWQTEWYGSFSLTEVIRLTGRFTVAQFLAREDFAKRYRANQPIAITELLYPLLQAYDSVAVKSDVEFGGTDQKFNLLVGRDLQEMMGQRPQQCFLVPLLPGTDGVQKMSKSLGNYIGVNDPPNEIFGKTMSLPDGMVISYLESLTDVPDGELEEMRQVMMGESVNPMEFKKRLGTELVTQFHDAQAARDAQEYFERTVQRRETPSDIAGYELPSPAELKGKRLSHILVDADLAASSAEARRLIDQGAVRINDEAISANTAVADLALRPDDILRAGKRRYVRIVAPRA